MVGRQSFVFWGPVTLQGENFGGRGRHLKSQGTLEVPKFHHHYLTVDVDSGTGSENGWLEYYFPFGMTYFQGRTVSFREGVYMYIWVQSEFKWLESSVIHISSHINLDSFLEISPLTNSNGFLCLFFSFLSWM